jgi:hypothetical protein
MALKKISHMGSDRGPRKILVAWMTNKCPCGHPQQTIRHGLASTLTDHLRLHSPPKMNDWIKLASDHGKWGEHIEVMLGLAPATYKPYAKCKDKPDSIASQPHQCCQLLQTSTQQNHHNNNNDKRRPQNHYAEALHPTKYNHHWRYHWFDTDHITPPNHTKTC